MLILANYCKYLINIWGKRINKEELTWTKCLNCSSLWKLKRLLQISINPIRTITFRVDLSLHYLKFVFIIASFHSYQLYFAGISICQATVNKTWHSVHMHNNTLRGILLPKETQQTATTAELLSEWSHYSIIKYTALIKQAASDFLLLVQLLYKTLPHF